MRRGGEGHELDGVAGTVRTQKPSGKPHMGTGK